MSKKFLEELNAVESKLLSATGQQAQMIIDQLMPRIKLAALESQTNSASVVIAIDFNFGEPSGPYMDISGSVKFPDHTLTQKVAP